MYVIVDVFCIYVTKYRAVQNGVLLYSVRKPVCEGRAVWGTYHCDFVKREEGNTCYRAEHLYLLFLIRQHRYNLSVVLSNLGQHLLILCFRHVDQSLFIRYIIFFQCFGSGSGSGRIRIIWSDPDPYQETLIWIRVAPKINQSHGINKSEWFVNVLFT